MLPQDTKIKFLDRKTYIEVIIYYSKDGEKYRPSTDVKFDPKYLLESGKISSKMPGYEQAIETIEAKQTEVETLIKEYKEAHRNEKPPVDWLKVEHKKLEAGQRQPQKQEPVAEPAIDLSQLEILHYWKDFVEEKKLTVRNQATINHYNNLHRALLQFKDKKNYKLTFLVLGQQFFNDLLDYMVNEHEFFRHPNQNKSDVGTVPEVGLSNETAIKRVKDFAEYLNYCSIEHDVNIKIEKIRKYIRLAKHKIEVKPLSKGQKWELTLTVDEIEFTVNLHHYEPEFWASLSDNQKRYIGILIFMCLQGTAPIDTKSISKADIKAGKIVKDRSKTGNEFKVELDPISQEILEANNYNLNFTDQTLNEELKRLFVTIFELYRLKFEAKHNQPYELICTQRIKKGDRNVDKMQHKGLFVELMTGRRSFLTNLGEKASEVGLKAAMDKAGHVKVETTLGYIHSRQQAGKVTSLFGIKKRK